MIEVKSSLAENVMTLADDLVTHFEGKGYEGRALFMATIDILTRADIKAAVDIIDILDENIVQVIPRRKQCRKRRR